MQFLRSTKVVIVQSETLRTLQPLYQCRVTDSGIVTMEIGILLFQTDSRPKQWRRSLFPVHRTSYASLIKNAYKVNLLLIGCKRTEWRPLRRGMCCTDGSYFTRCSRCRCSHWSSVGCRRRWSHERPVFDSVVRCQQPHCPVDGNCSVRVISRLFTVADCLALAWMSRTYTCTIAHIQWPGTSKKRFIDETSALLDLSLINFRSRLCLRIGLLLKAKFSLTPNCADSQC